MSEIVPDILTANFSELVKDVNLLKGITNRVHLDIIDGKFAPMQTISLEALKTQPIDLKIDLHLMVKEPEDWVHRALEVLPDRLIAQTEMLYDPRRFISETAEGGMEVGIALDIETPVEAISEEVYHMVDLILILAAKAGASGQEFNPKALEKISRIRKSVGDLVEVGVDCGLNEKTIPLCKQAGASVFCVNSAFWSFSDLAKRYNDLTQLINK